MDKIVLYNIPDTVINSVQQRDDTGFISFDFKSKPQKVKPVFNSDEAYIDKIFKNL